MPFPSWTFRPMERGEINVDPVHDEFFKAQDLADALVRESIQNSLDARRGHATVRVRFRLASIGAREAARYVIGLEPHFASAAPELHAAIPREAPRVPFLLVEDQGTRGLTGDPAGDPDLDEDAARNDFYYFWRNVGRSSKGEQDRGRWGLGKAVFAVSSRIRTLFGLTHRADDGRRLLLGQCVLKTHVLGGTKYDPYGFCARFDRHLPLPIETPTLVETFCRDFGVERSEPGLSIVVPWFREEELSLERITASVIRQYFYPIVRGDLVVHVEDPARSETIQSRTIDEAGARLLGESAASLRKLCDLTRWSMSGASESMVMLQLPGPGQPKWSESLLPVEERDALRDRFERGERLALRVPLAVRKRKRTVHSRFDVFLQKDETLRRAEQHFIRRGITITDVRVANDKPVRALAVIDDEPLSTLLGDAENPAHSDWMERADKVKHYELGPSTVRFVKQSIAQLSAMLTRPPAGRVADLLADLFSIEAGEEATLDRGEDGATANAGDRPGDTASAQLPAGFHSRGPRITSVRGGFVIRGRGGEEGIGQPHRAEVAYRCRTGNPFRKYDPLDFELGGSVQVASSGAEIGAMEKNALAFIPRTAEYEIAVTGFDARRDIVVRVEEAEADASEAELH